MQPQRALAQEPVEEERVLAQLPPQLNLARPLPLQSERPPVVEPPERVT